MRQNYQWEYRLITEGLKDTVGDVTGQKRGKGNDNTTEVNEVKRMSEMSGAKQSVGYNESTNKVGGLNEKSETTVTQYELPSTWVLCIYLFMFI